METQTQDKSIVWLHLSDLHLCNPKTGWDSHRVLVPLKIDLKNMEKEYGLSPHFIFFTGDAAFGQINAHSGQSLNEQFDDAHKLFEQVRNAFHRPVPKNNVFLVPGNHDVDRSQVDISQTEWLDSQNKVEVVTDLIKQAKIQWQRIMDRLVAYREFLKRHEYKHLLTNPEQLIYVQLRKVNNIKIGIVGLNTAWSSSREKEKGKLWMGGNWQIGELTRQLPDTAFRIALMHHPLNWFTEHEDPILRSLIEREFRFLLHGHEHQGWVDEKNDGHVRIAAAACYDRSEKDNGYNFVRLDLNTGDMNVWLRRYDQPGGGWVPRIVANHTDRNGMWSLKESGWLEELIGKKIPEQIKEAEAGKIEKGVATNKYTWERNPFPPSRLLISHRLFIGRKTELKILDRAWASGDASGTKLKRNLICIVAVGGMGKTTLVGEWLAHLIANRWRGAKRFFDWSFYRQGSSDQLTASADDFFDTALRWFGEPNPEKLTGWTKGERLATLVAEHRTLLILDGLEPLQQPSGSLNDDALKALFSGLSQRNPGLCIITTRVAIPELAPHEGRSCIHLKLQQLDLETGVALLRKLGVTIGTVTEMRQAVKEFRGHALALTLLGRYIAVVYNGNIRQRTLVPVLPTDDEEGIHARKMMESYESWLKGRAESDILHLLGLFNGPTEGEAIKVLLREPVIMGLTDNVCNLNDAKWKFAVKSVRDLGLLASRDEKRPDILDCHPLVREHFGVHLRTTHPNAWQEGHHRLYEYYKEIPNEKYPKTLSDMMPLFRAVAHGCHAGLYQETMDDVYWERIRQCDEHYSTQKLGAYGADQEALSAFFSVLWSKPVKGITDHWKGVVLIWAGELLRATGRLREAKEPMQASLEMAIKLNELRDAAGRAEILSDLLLRLGEINEAVKCGRKSIDFTDPNQENDMVQRELSHTTLANALHQAGQFAEAERLFTEAERLQQNRSSKELYPYSVGSYRFCDLLLSQGEFHEVQKRAILTIDIARKNKWPLGIALGSLSLGRSYLLQAQYESPLTGSEQVPSILQKAAQYLEQAVQELREAGTQHELPLGLIARAELHRVTGAFASAWCDLAEAHEISEWGNMQLYLADFHLEAAHLFCAVKQTANQPQLHQVVDAFFKVLPDSEKAGVKRKNKSLLYSEFAMLKIRKHLASAKQMIEQMGYGRRQSELVKFENELLS